MRMTAWDRMGGKDLEWEIERGWRARMRGFGGRGRWTESIEFGTVLEGTGPGEKENERRRNKEGVTE